MPRGRVKKQRGQATCRGCGVVFQLHTDSGKGEYCSQKCAASFTGKRTMEQNRFRAPVKKLVFKECPTCHKNFPSWKGANRIYCSQQCSVGPVIAKGYETKRRNGTLVRTNTHSRCARGWRQIGSQRIFARSSWEANYGRYLEFLKNAGEIIGWEHEAKTFWFDSIKRGCRSYKPDFRVTLKAKSPDLLGTPDIEYHEVKGWMTQRSITALKRMRIHHPSVVMVLIDSKRYRGIAKTCKAIIPGWE